MGQEAHKLGNTRAIHRQEIDPDAVLNALSTVVVVVDGELIITHINNAGEQLFQSSVAHLKGQRLDRFIPADSPLFALIRQARDHGDSVAEYHVNLVSPRIGRHVANVQVTPLADAPGTVVVSMQERTVRCRLSQATEVSRVSMTIWYLDEPAKVVSLPEAMTSSPSSGFTRMRP